VVTEPSGVRAATDATQASAERIRELNERVIEYARKAGGAYLDVYERSLKTIVDYEESLANATAVDWLQQVLEAQANLTREIGEMYASTARDMLMRT
jgi:hypothetical protein